MEITYACFCLSYSPIHYKVTDERGYAVTRAIYNVLGIDREGHKNLLGMYISKNKGANFLLRVPVDMNPESFLV